MPKNVLCEKSEIADQLCFYSQPIHLEEEESERNGYIPSVSSSYRTLSM